MRIKISLIFSIMILILGCKESVSQRTVSVKDYTVDRTKNDGGQFSRIQQSDLNKLLDTLYKETSKNLKTEKKKILLFDIFSNKTNYIWYISDQETNSFFRFISDLKFENIQYQKIQKSIIKNELTFLTDN